MLKIKLAAGIAAAALLTSAALAQTTTAPAGQAPAPAQQQTQTTAPAPSAAGAGQIMTAMPADMFRGSKLMGVDVYGSDNQKIGDVDELILDKDGKIHAIVVGIGGFLGIGKKDVAIPYDQVEWMSSEEVRTAAGTQTGTTTTAGGVTTPAAPAGTAGQPATTGSTGGTMGTAGTTTTAGAASDNTPARAMVKMSKGDLENAPEFRYSTAAATTGTGATGTTSPPANRPATQQ